MEGEKEAIEKLIEYCKEGPPGSRVDDVEVSWEKPTHKYKEFEIRVH
jgi:acylphosphatase